MMFIIIFIKWNENPVFTQKFKKIHQIMMKDLRELDMVSSCFVVAVVVLLPYISIRLVLKKMFLLSNIF